jgi:hypothetical protein
MRKPLPFTRSLAEFSSRNRSQKDVTTTSVDQMAPAATASTSILTTTHQSSPHHMKGKIQIKERHLRNSVIGIGETSPEKFLSGIFRFIFILY